MASKPDDNSLNDLVARVRNEVLSDTRIAERGYFVHDLQSSIKGFGPKENMWEISYKTTSAEALNAGLKDKVAWEISYKTSKVGADLVTKNPQ
ncbi:MAG: hypothetical protein ACKO01_04875 [Erythrobacter sp.]